MEGLNLEKYLEQMKRTILLSSLSADEIKHYLNEGSFKTTSYGKNNIVHSVGEICSRLEIILLGRVVVELIDESGNLMTVAEFLSDDILGGNFCFLKIRYPMTITSKQSTLILRLKRTVISAALRQS